MKVKAFQLIRRSVLSCIPICVVLSILSPEAVGQTAIKDKKMDSDRVAVILTRYDVKKGSEYAFREALKNYAVSAVENENNIMAEAFFEQEQPLVMWVIERWSSKKKFDEFGRTQPADAVLCLSKNALLKPAQTIYVKDLEPISKKQWRTAALQTDTPLVIMLFIDTKPGTEQHFQEIYHRAMPQFRSEPGVINYQLSQFNNDSGQFVTYEKFRNEDAFQYHLKFPPIQPVIDFLNTSIVKQPFQLGLHRLVPFPSRIQ